MNVKDILNPTVRLLVITAIAAALLGFVRDVTLDPIAERQKEGEAAAISSIFANADESKEEVIESELVSRVLSVYAQGEFIGYAVFTSSVGYGGAVDLLVGVNADKVIQGVQILNHTETPGLGANAANAPFLDQYKDKSQALTVSKSAPAGNEIQAITSATITSTAVTNGVNSALIFVSSLPGGGK
ncbi:MAG: RnfABCDGE type electron transport complex subunit G [Clostridiales bacterium]|jgi:electron transport complex protein RnfG|nr:RnfABCDGE type electron transport complex subunit G [Clostridiales bacterium]